MDFLFYIYCIFKITDSFKTKHLNGYLLYTLLLTVKIMDYLDCAKSAILDLDITGFVIVDDLNQPYWIRILHGKPRMLIWLDRARKWVTWHPLGITKIPVWRERAIPQKHAEGYHKAHLKTTGIDLTKF